MRVILVANEWKRGLLGDGATFRWPPPSMWERIGIHAPGADVRDPHVAAKGLDGENPRWGLCWRSSRIPSSSSPFTGPWMTAPPQLR
jgi:hypothetical protein